MSNSLEDASRPRIQRLTEGLRSRLLLPTTRFRRHRMEAFFDAFPVSEATRILDVGGTDINWRLIDCPAHIVLLNISIPDESPDLPPNMRYVVGDGTRMDYA